MLKTYSLREDTLASGLPTYELIETAREFPLGCPVRKVVAVLFSQTDGMAICELLNDARRQGVAEGIERFAWWLDGEQRVGTCGTTLKQALAELEKE